MLSADLVGPAGLSRAVGSFIERGSAQVTARKRAWSPTSEANFSPANTADNWLHFGLGAGMVALGVVRIFGLRGYQAPNPSR